MVSPEPLSPVATPEEFMWRARPRRLFWTAMLILALAAATILTALGFEHIGGYQPCPLCLMQRTPYYFSVPLAAAAALATWLRAPRLLLAILFALIAVAMAYNTALAAYHSGVEWRWWEGPAACAPSVGVNSAADMLNQLENERAPSCTDAPWRMLGLSFAGWNVFASALLAGIALYGVVRAFRPAPA